MNELEKETIKALREELIRRVEKRGWKLVRA